MPLLFGGFIALLNETLLNVAFPQLMSTLNVSTSTVQWLGTAYMLVIGILVPVVAFLLKTFPTKTLYLMAMILFTAGTIFCGISQTFPVLLISRMVQGAGTGMLIPIMVNTVLERTWRSNHNYPATDFRGLRFFSVHWIDGGCPG